jgi:hypothetical protein
MARSSLICGIVLAISAVSATDCDEAMIDGARADRLDATLDMYP